jgi:hypothetical protein
MKSERHRRMALRNTLWGLLGLALAAASVGGCNKEWDAAQGRSALSKAGYTVSPATPDPTAKTVPNVKDGECFDVSKGDQAARVCVWTCETGESCASMPQQKIWLHGTIGRRKAYVDTKDDAFGHTVLSALHP